MGTRKREVEAPPRSLISRLRDGLYDPRVILLLGVCCAAPFLMNLLKRSGTNFAELPQYQVDRASIQLKNPPEYLPDDLLERTWQRASLPAQFSLLEPGLAERIGKAFEEYPWVRQVEQIRLSYPNQIEINLEYRAPAALVKLRQGYYPVDRDGVLLPPMDFSATQLPLYPVIEGISSPPRGSSGVHWGDLAVWGAAQLAEQFMTISDDQESLWHRYKFAAIQVSGSGEQRITTTEELQRIEYRLVTEQGSEVIWGVAPAVPDPTEPNAETKLKRLAMYLRDFGGLHSAQGPMEIDLRRWKEIARRPLPTPETRTR